MTWESTIAEALDETTGLVSFADPQPEIQRLPFRIVLEQGTVRAEIASLTGRGADGQYSIVRGQVGSDPSAHPAGAAVTRSLPLSLLGLGGGSHPNLAAHETLGLAPDDHTHPGGDHPDVATHEALGLSAEDHTHAEYATDGDLTTHAATAHGLSAHALDGAFHSGAEVLPTQGQKNALAGTQGTPGTTNQYVTTQDARLSDARTPTAHDHDADYAATDHEHTLQDADIPAAIARDAEVTSAISTHAATPHGGGGEVYAVGDLYLTITDYADATAVATRHGYGTWARFGVGRFLLGTDTTAEVEAGSATHAHSFTQPSGHADHAAQSHSAHAGATVGNHTFTQPGAHSDHAALSHSAHAGATVGNHTDVTNHVHVQSVNSATTGGLSGYAPDTSTNTSTTSGYSTANPTTIGVAAMVHTVGQASAHSDHAAQSHSAHSGGAVDAHSVGQANAHSDHAALSHDAHAGGAVADGSTAPLSITAFLWKRTA